jgi:hypothetical protein
VLANVIDAHGGLDRWKKLNSVTATIVTGGGLTGTAARLAMKRTNFSSGHAAHDAPARYPLYQSF